MSLPVTGETNWGVPLNEYITDTVLALANQAATAIATHQTATDPHGDRAYALQLVQPLTAGTNGPNGFLQLDSIGKIPAGVLPTGGGRTSTFDVVKDYEAPVNGVTDASPAIQSALNDCATSGGGEVWVGDGAYGIGETLVIGSNTWLHLSPGATMTRIVGQNGQAPVYMLANFNVTNSNSGADNILIQGGQWNFAAQTPAGIPMVFVDGTQIVVEDTTIATLALSPAILLAGCQGFDVYDVLFSTPSVGARAVYAETCPAIQIETATSTAINGLNSGMYTNAPCSMIDISKCAVSGATATDSNGTFVAFNGLVGTFAPVAGSFHSGIMVTSNFAPGMPTNGVYAANWQTMTVANNQFNTAPAEGQPVSVAWTPSAPALASQVITDNTPFDIGTEIGLYKAAGTPRLSSTTVAADPDLSVVLPTNSVWAVRGVLLFDGANANGYFKWQFSIPGGSFRYAVTYTPTGGGQALPVVIEYHISSDSVAAWTGGTSALQAITFEGTLINTSPGDFALMWAQSQTNATATTLLTSTNMTLTRIA